MPEFDSTIAYRQVPGFPNYQVGNDGSVWSNIPPPPYHRRHLATVIPVGPWHQMHPSRDPRGYCIVSLSHPFDHRKPHMVHRLVLLAFVGPPRRGRQCRHLNGCKWDNRLENLAWGTARQNARDRIRHGTAARGHRAGSAKLTPEQVIAIRHLAATGTRYKDLCDEFGVTDVTISRIVNRRGWIHV